MVADALVIGELATARKLVELLEQDGFRLDAAVWAADDEGHSRLYLVPTYSNNDRDELRQTVRVAYTISAHRDELPDRHELRYSIVNADHPIIQAVGGASAVSGKLRGLYKDGTYIDTAYVLRPAA